MNYNFDISTLLEAYDSTILEEFKKGKNEQKEREQAVLSFFSFLKKKHPKKAEECAKDPKKMKSLIKMNAKEFAEWANEHRVLAGILIALSGGVLATTMMNVNLQQANMQGHKMAMDAHNQSMIMHQTLHNQSMNLHNTAHMMGMGMM